MAAAAVFCVAGGASNAASVDLTGWAENGNPNNNAGTWTVQPGNDSVYQSINGTPTVFFNPGANAQGTQLGGTISVSTSDTDDDFIGFVLGYQDNEINSNTADFWLVDWKRGAQSGQTAGLALSHVSGDLQGTNTGTGGQWWQHDAPVNEVQRASTLGTTGYVRGQTYTFDLVFTQNLIEVMVDGVTELSFTSADNGGLFTDGSFGFYNFSQPKVTYAGITQAALPSVPLPAALPMLLAGVAGLSLIRRRKRS